MLCWSTWRYVRWVRNLDAIDAELRLVAALRRYLADLGSPMPSIDVADALLDERNIVCRCAASR